MAFESDSHRFVLHHGWLHRFTPGILSLYTYICLYLVVFNWLNAQRKLNLRAILEHIIIFLHDLLVSDFFHHSVLLHLILGFIHPPNPTFNLQ